MQYNGIPGMEPDAGPGCAAHDRPAPGLHRVQYPQDLQVPSLYNNMNIYQSLCLTLSLSLYIYIYIYVCICMYIYIYICTYKELCILPYVI